LEANSQTPDAPPGTAIDFTGLHFVIRSERCFHYFHGGILPESLGQGRSTP
jgi:hypothetical protein